MNHICAKFFLFFTLLILVSSVSPVFVASDKYVKTGVFYIASSQFLSDLITNGYTVQFSNCAVSSDVYKVGLSLYSLNINFNNLTIMFDLQVTSTSVAGFNITFSTTMGTFISLMKVCYIVKNPSYTDVFYIQNYRYTGPGFVVTKTGNSSYTQLYNLTTQIPASSVSSPALMVIPYLYAFNFESTVSGVQNNIDIYPNLVVVDQNTVQFMMQTLFNDVKVAYYSFTAVIYDGVQIWNSNLSLFTFGDTLSAYSSMDLYYSSAPAQMLQTSTFIGLKAFHVCTQQIPNFLEFETTFPNNSYVTFPSKNDINWGYMEFQIVVIEAGMCPWSAPYFIYYLNDCQNTIPVGYVKNCVGNYIINLQMNLSYIIKNPSQNQVEFMFNLEPSDPSLSNILSQVDWNNALQFDFPGTKNTQFISSPFPQLKLTVDYTGNLESLQKTMTISAYNSALFPVNFAGWTQTNVPLQMTSLNNMALNFYDDSVYSSAKGIGGVCIFISVLTMVFFLIGLIAGKIYVLQMAFVLEVTFLSLVSLKRVTPTMSSLSYLRYVFGYWIPGNDGTVFSQEPRNYMKLIGISDYFLLNFNIMFIFFILTFVLGIVFHFKEKFKARRFFLLDTPLYLVLWFGMWFWCTGQIQIRQFTIYHESNALGICGILFFILCLIIFIGYFVLYYIKNSDIDSFYSHFNTLRTQPQNGIWSKTKYFYLILFIQRIILGTLFAHAYSFVCLNIILIVIHLAIIALIIIFKPYKLRNITKLPQLQKEKKFIIPPLLRANIRQILNYSLLILILIFLFITNQIQQSQFSIYIPVIVLIFLFIVIILTVFFLIYDKRLKEDFEEFKKIFDNYQQPHKSQTIDQKLNTTDKKVTQDEIVIDFDQPATKYNLMPQKSVDPFEMSFSPKKSPRKSQNDLKYSFGQNQRNNPSIDQQLMKIAENKQEMYRKNKEAGIHDPQISRTNGSRFKNYHQIMKGVTPNTGLKESSYPNNYYPENQRNLKNFPFAYNEEE